MSIEKLVRKELTGQVQVSATRRRVAAAPGTISLAAGDPNFLLPEYIAKTVYDAIREGKTHYCFGGEPALRNALVKYYSKYGYEAQPNQITITAGGSQSLFQAYAAILNAGDEGISFDPAYGGGRSAHRFFGVKTVFAAMKKKDGLFRPDLEALKEVITPKTKSLYIDNPGNPSGAVFTKEELKGIAELAVDHNFVVVSDETYSEFCWDGTKHEALITYPGMENRTLVCMAFTKMYSWAGMRTGWIVAGPEIAPYVSRAPGSAISWPIQLGAVKAITDGYEYVEAIKKEYEERLDYGTKRLNEMPGVTCTKPEGAFYLFPNISCTSLSSNEFVQKLGEEERVRIVSGAGYGPGAAEGYVRLSMIRPLSTQKMPGWFKNEPDTCFEVAMDRIERFVKKYLK